MYIIPILNSLEFKGSYLNLEERPQSTQTLKTNYFPTLQNIIQSFLLRQLNIEKIENLISIFDQEFIYEHFIYHLKDLPELNFFFILIDSPQIFDNIKIEFS